MTVSFSLFLRRLPVRVAFSAPTGWLMPGRRALLLVLLGVLGWGSAPLALAQVRAAKPPAPSRPAVAPPLPSKPPERRGGDFIVAVVNQELVTNSEVQQRLTNAVQEAGGNVSVPAREELERRVLDQLIDERAQLSHARDSGMRVEEAEIDRAVGSIASQNQLSLAELRDRLRQDGLDYGRFRTNLRDQLLLERVREREVQTRIVISDRDIENWLTEERQRTGLASEYNIAQIVIAVPENAGPAEVAVRRARAVELLQRLRGGEDFAALVRSVSDGPKDKDGQLGMRAAAKLPDIFVEAVQPLLPGEVAPQVLRSGAGFHILKLIARQDAALTVTQQHARHILLRLGPQLSEATAIRRLAGYKRDVDAGRARFEDLARRHSDDGSAEGGGDLGWAGPGLFVPEFEQAMVTLAPGQISDPVVSRFGVHLIQLIERRAVPLDVRQQREMARNALREKRYAQAYAEWARDVRARAFVDLREPPQL
jgi:peptidyl-prolyl cis-trans isomerase SurA